jgi:hypothetical protein
MIDIIPYIVIIIIIILLFSYLYIKQKYGFWVSQPVFHVYDFYYYLHSVGIINKDLPKKNKYTNFKNIETSSYPKLIDYHKQQLMHFIRKNFHREKNGNFMPELNNILPYFTNNNYDSFISFYYQPKKLLNKDGKIIDDNDILGVMCSKPLNIFIKSDNANFECYYVDYLCVKKGHRTKGIAPQIIQTHHYNQSHLNKNISISLFKREGELTGIVPICVYDTYGFPVINWTKPSELENYFSVVLVNKSNLSLFFHFISLMKNKFDLSISVSMSNLLDLINSENIYITILILNDDIQACYLFRKSCIYYNNLESLICFGSINNTNDEIFISGFKISFWKIAEKYFFGYCIIENLSDNYIIIPNILLKTTAESKSPTAYFFYNFAYSTFLPKNVFILN